MAISSFRHKGLEQLFDSGRSGKIGNRYHKVAIKILDHLEAITDLQDCEGVKDFHELGGARRGTYSMHVNGNYCITFKWSGANVFDVDFEDYHRK